jgi:hypothetical protein
LLQGERPPLPIPRPPLWAIGICPAVYMPLTREAADVPHSLTLTSTPAHSAASRCPGTMLRNRPLADARRRPQARWLKERGYPVDLTSVERGALDCTRYSGFSRASWNPGSPYRTRTRVSAVGAELEKSGEPQLTLLSPEIPSLDTQPVFGLRCAGRSSCHQRGYRRKHVIVAGPQAASKVNGRFGRR